MTSSLPRTRSYHLSYVGITLERETGLEPATNSLEGCDSTTELLPPLAITMWWREEDSNLRSSQGAADLQSAAINHSAISPDEPNRWSWRRDLNPRPSDYKSDALPTELRQPVGKHPNLAKSRSQRKHKYRRGLQNSAAGSLPGMATKGTKRAERCETTTASGLCVIRYRQDSKSENSFCDFCAFCGDPTLLTKWLPIIKKAEHHVCGKMSCPLRILHKAHRATRFG